MKRPLENNKHKFVVVRKLGDWSPEPSMDSFARDFNSRPAPFVYSGLGCFPAAFFAQIDIMPPDVAIFFIPKAFAVTQEDKIVHVR